MQVFQLPDAMVWMVPRGIYPRTTNQLQAAKRNLALGRSPEARRKAQERLAQIATDPEWRAKVSRSTCAAMRSPEVRARHLAGLANQPANFRGGNGQEPVPIVKLVGSILSPLGFVPEYPIKTKGHQTGLNTPRHYKADFANPETRVVVEIDGPSHRPLERKALDSKKTAVLESLGWRVVRIEHGQILHADAFLPMNKA